MRTTSDFWVSAYIKMRNAAHKPTVLMKRGAKEAGAVFVRLDRLDNSYDLFEPASQLSYSQEQVEKGERLFTRTLTQCDIFQIMDRMEREDHFDPDYWLVETECSEGCSDLTLADEDF